MPQKFLFFEHFQLKIMIFYSLLALLVARRKENPSRVARERRAADMINRKIFHSDSHISGRLSCDSFSVFVLDSRPLLALRARKCRPPTWNLPLSAKGKLFRVIFHTLELH